MSDSAEPPAKRAQWYMQFFKEEWLNDPLLKTWLRRDNKDSYSGYYKCCSIILRNQNKSMLIKPSCSLKHKKNYKAAEISCDISQFVVKKQSKESETHAKSVHFLLSHILQNMTYHLQTADHFLSMSKRVFPDSEIAKKLSLKRTKLTY